MIKIVLVDDEKISLYALGKFIEKTRSDVKVVGQFENISDAISFLEENEADLVITDIRMPSGSGIDLAHYIMENFPEIKIVFVSAYSDFEYAKEAISLNVKYYLSKPIDLEELSNMLDKLVNIINSEKREQGLYQKYDNLITWAKTDLYTDIISGDLTDKQKIFKLAQNVELTEENMNSCHAVLLMRFENTAVIPKGHEEYYAFFDNLLQKLNFVDEYVILTKDGNKIKLLIRFLKELDVSAAKFRLSFYKDYLQNEFLKSFGSKLTLDINFICSSLFELCGYQNEVNSMRTIKTRYQELSTAIFLGNADRINELFESVVNYANTLDIEQAKKIFVDMFNHIENSFDISNSESNETFDISLLSSAKTKGELTEYAKAIFDKIIELKKKLNVGIESFIIQKAKNYVKNNYMNDIMLEDIANYVHLNSFYFSKFFKAKTGMNLTDYIVSFRMKTAKELFNKGTYKIYEISEMCGYKSRKYFSQVFKQYTGYTPSEYQRMIALNVEDYADDHS